MSRGASLSRAAMRMLVVIVVAAGLLLLAWDWLRSAYGYMKAYAIGWLLSTSSGRRLLQAIAVDTTLTSWGL
jgi:hypothetical protein